MKKHPLEKTRLHHRNRHTDRYDFGQLISNCPELAQFVMVNIYNNETIDFSNSEAVKMLNKALLKHYYNINDWDIPQNYLCPPIPGRADYIHHIADILGSKNNGMIPKGTRIKCMDIGVGANCVYPIIGNKEYGWSFIGTDIDPVSIKSAARIIESNSSLHGKIELRLQHNPKDIYNGIIHKNELIDLSICNPPFHASIAEAQTGTIRKLKNLTQKEIVRPILNFGGQNNELWCPGGEVGFVKNMISQSKEFSGSCYWFSTLIAKQSNLRSVYGALKKVETSEVKTIPMGHGNKISRIVAWTFLSADQQRNWMDERWKLA